ncbi:hypothetical protein HPB50_020675 [Hyalomma asiaticum]|uniref:Uncharacterized protein n=1 Tax=Hyalomma asiaticum TaxID=266040 RepID=A0ACB7SJ90_HYAAI|nr:hypothetical protein HPB50_020675 [Hyalomma asiaticum]
METKKRQHNALSLATKVRIIQELDRNNLSKTEIAKKFNIPKSTLSRILKNKGKIEEAVKLGNFATDRMRMRTTAYKEIEDVLFLWFKRARSANFPISGPILEEKAKEIATRMGIEDFQVSDGWLSRFKKRHGLVLKTVSGERFSIQEVLPDKEDNIAEAEEADILFSQVTQSTSFTREDYETLDANVATCREDSLEELIAEVQDEDPCSSGDEMVCDPGPISVPDSAARDAVILLQRYFEHNGGTEFLPSLSAMHSYFVRKCLNKAKQTVITSFFPSQQY